MCLTGQELSDRICGVERLARWKPSTRRRPAFPQPTPIWEESMSHAGAEDKIFGPEQTEEEFEVPKPQ